MSSSSNGTLSVTVPDQLTRCGVATIKWAGGTPPYKVRLTNGGSYMLEILAENTTSTEAEYRVSNRFDRGTNMVFKVNDAAGGMVDSKPHFLKDSEGLDCIFAPGWNRDKAALVGICVGGAAFVLLAVLLFCCVRRLVRSRRRGARRDAGGGAMGHLKVFGGGAGSAARGVSGGRSGGGGAYAPLVDGAKPMGVTSTATGAPPPSHSPAPHAYPPSGPAPGAAYGAGGTGYAGAAYQDPYAYSDSAPLRTPQFTPLTDDLPSRIHSPQHPAPAPTGGMV